MRSFPTDFPRAYSENSRVGVATNPQIRDAREPIKEPTGVAGHDMDRRIRRQETMRRTPRGFSPASLTPCSRSARRSACCCIRSPSTCCCRSASLCSSSPPRSNPPRSTGRRLAADRCARRSRCRCWRCSPGRRCRSCGRRFTVEAWQQSLRYLGLPSAVACALGLTRPHARATEIYFVRRPASLLAMASGVRLIWIGGQARRDVRFRPHRARRALLIATLVYPGDGRPRGARARMAHARALLVLALVFLYAIRSPGVMIAFLAGFTVLSFAFTGPERAAREMSWIAAGVIGLAPFVVLVAQPLLRADPQRQTADPAAALSVDRLCCSPSSRATACGSSPGHGFETVDARRAGRRPAAGDAAGRAVSDLVRTRHRRRLGRSRRSPSSPSATIGKAARRASRPILPRGWRPRSRSASPQTSLDDWAWLMMLGLALVAADVAARSEYRTSRPSADELASDLTGHGSPAITDS